MDSSCFEITLFPDLDRMRSNSLSTSGCGESKQMVNFGVLECLVATSLRVLKTSSTGKRVGRGCSRIDTDEFDEFRSVSHKRKNGEWIRTDGDLDFSPVGSASVKPRMCRSTTDSIL